MYKKVKIICTVFVFSISPMFIYSQEQKDGITNVISGLRSQDEIKIEKAYLALIDKNREIKREYRNIPEINKSIWVAFTFLVPKPIDLRTGEGDESSLALNLLYKMGDIKEQRATPYLLANIHDHGCDFVLAKMGDSVVYPVLEILANGNENQQRGAARTLEQMLRPKSKIEYADFWDAEKKVVTHSRPNPFFGDYEPNEKVREKIKVVLKEQLKRNDSKVKKHILDAFNYVADDGDVVELEQIAKVDTEKQGGRYVIRKRAQKILDKIKIKKTENNKLDRL